LLKIREHYKRCLAIAGKYKNMSVLVDYVNTFVGLINLRAVNAVPHLFRLDILFKLRNSRAPV